MWVILQVNVDKYAIHGVSVMANNGMEILAIRNIPMSPATVFMTTVGVIPISHQLWSSWLAQHFKELLWILTQELQWMESSEDQICLEFRRCFRLSFLGCFRSVWAKLLLLLEACSPSFPVKQKLFGSIVVCRFQSRCICTIHALSLCLFDFCFVQFFFQFGEDDSGRLVHFW